MELPYKPLIGKWIDNKHGGYCPIGWTYCQLWGRKNIVVKEDNSIHAKIIAYLPEKKISIYEKLFKKFGKDLNKITILNDKGQHKKAFRKLPGLLKKHRQVLEAYNGNVDKALTKVRKVIKN